MSRRATHAIVQLRHLACLDATGPESIALVLRELHHVIGFDSGCFIHPGAGEEVDVYMENPALRAAVPDYFDPRILHSEMQVLHRSSRQFSETLHRERGVQRLHQLAKVPLPELLRSDFYNVVLRPGDVGDALSLSLRTHEGYGVGVLKLYRRGWQHPFSDEDATALGQLEALLAHALHPHPATVADSEACGHGLLVVSPEGHIHWLSPEVRKLLALAFGAHWRDGALPDGMRLLLQRLFQTNASDAQTPLPQLTLRNAHGHFQLRASQLAGTNSETAAAIHITRRLPRGLLLLERLGRLGLPRRQCELAYWLERGLPEARIAERLGVSLNTTIYHRRQLYNRLGVGNRPELIARLGELR